MKTVRRPPYPKWNPGYFPCSSLTPLPLSSRRPSVSFGGFGLKETTAVIVDRSKGRPLVVDTLPAAPGVTAGMTLEQALSRHTDTTVLEADEPSYQKVFHRMLTSLQRISDRVEGPE